MKLINLLFVLLAASLTIPAVAQVETAEESVQTSDDNSKKRRGHRAGKKAEKILERIDSNEDGQIDLSEYLTNAEQRFQAMDIDSNGFVTTQEMRAHHKEMRNKHRQARKAAKSASSVSDDAPATE